MRGGAVAELDAARALADLGFGVLPSGGVGVVSLIVVVVLGLVILGLGLKNLEWGARLGNIGFAASTSADEFRFRSMNSF